MDQPNYEGYPVGEQDISLVPAGSQPGMTAAMAFYQVSDIKASLEALRQDGGQVLQESHDVGYGKLTASTKDADGNLIGLIQLPKA